MELRDKQKEFSMASGGRMFLLLGGIMLVFTALTNTGQYGVQMFRIAAEAAKGTEEFVEVVKTLGMGLTALRVMGAAFLVTALVEVTAGIWCIRSCNRIDRWRTTLRVVVALLAVEIIMQIYLLVTKMGGLGALFSALLMPLVLLWGVTRFRKLAKLDPERVYAFKKKEAQPQAPQQPQRPKSLRERAMMSANLEPEEEEEENAGDEPEEGSEAGGEPEEGVGAGGEPEEGSEAEGEPEESSRAEGQPEEGVGAEDESEEGSGAEGQPEESSRTENESEEGSRS